MHPDKGEFTFVKNRFISVVVVQVEITLQVLVSHSQGVRNINEIANTACKGLKIFMFCLIPHCPLVN